MSKTRSDFIPGNSIIPNRCNGVQKRRMLKHRVSSIVISIGIALFLYGLLWLDILYASIFTPNLLEAVKKMSFSEALFSPKHVFHLWIATHVLSSPILTIVYIAGVTSLIMLVLRARL